MSSYEHERLPEEPEIVSEPLQPDNSIPGQLLHQGELVENDEQREFREKQERAAQAFIELLERQPYTSIINLTGSLISLRVHGNPAELDQLQRALRLNLVRILPPLRRAYEEAFGPVPKFGEPAETGPFAPSRKR